MERLDFANLNAAEKAHVEALISVGTVEIERICNRTFLQATYTDEAHDGYGWDFIFVKNPPIVSLTDIDLITYNAVTGDTETTTYAASKFTFHANTGEIKFKPDVTLSTAKLFPVGFQNIHITYSGGYAAVPQAIQMLCADFVIQMFDSKELDGALIEKEKQGDEFISFGTDYFNRLPFSKKKILTSYQLRRVA